MIQMSSVHKFLPSLLYDHIPLTSVKSINSRKFSQTVKSHETMYHSLFEKEKSKNRIDYEQEKEKERKKCKKMLESCKRC